MHKYLIIAIAAVALILWFMLGFVALRTYHRGWRKVDIKRMFNKDAKKYNKKG